MGTGQPTVSSLGFTSYDFWERQHQDSGGSVFLEEGGWTTVSSPPAAGLKVVIYIHCCLLNLSQHLHSSWWLTQWQDSFIHPCRVLLRLWLLCALFTTKMGKLVLEAILRQWGITWVPNICLPSPTAGTVPPSPRDQDQISLQQSCCCLVPGSSCSLHLKGTINDYQCVSWINCSTKCGLHWHLRHAF